MPARVTIDGRTPEEGRKTFKGRSIASIIRTNFGEKATFLPRGGGPDGTVVLNGQILADVVNAQEWKAYVPPPSRQTRWDNAIEKMREAMEDMESLKDEKIEYEELKETYDEDPENNEEPEFDESMANSRVEDATAKFEEGSNELEELQAEYQDWYDNLSEGLQMGPTGEKLEEVINMSFETVEFDLEDLESGINEADNLVAEYEGVDLPLGWGRD